jgi:transcriptional regulator with XRE-family HTH domain
MNRLINDRLRQARQALQLSQVAFSRGIHLKSSGYYADIELGNHEVNERIVELASSIYGISKNWLKTGEGEMFDHRVDQKFEELSVLFNQLNPNFQNYVLGQIKNLVKLQEQELAYTAGGADGPTARTRRTTTAPKGGAVAL